MLKSDTFWSKKPRWQVRVALWLSQFHNTHTHVYETHESQCYFGFYVQYETKGFFGGPALLTKFWLVWDGFGVTKYWRIKPYAFIA